MIMRVVETCTRDHLESCPITNTCLAGCHGKSTDLFVVAGAASASGNHQLMRLMVTDQQQQDQHLGKQITYIRGSGSVAIVTTGAAANYTESRGEAKKLIN